MKFKKLLAAVVAIGAIACTSAFAAGTLSLVTDSTEVEPGAQVTVDLNLSNNPGMICFMGKLTATGDITMAAKPTAGDVLTGASLGSAKLPYTVNFVNEEAEEDFTDDGTIVTFKFNIPETAANGDEYTLTFTPTKSGCLNAALSQIKDFNTPTLTLTVVAEEVVTDPYTLSAAAAGNVVDGQKTYYTTVTVNEAKSGAKFQVAANGTTKSWALPAICGSGSFVAIVGTNNETGTFANSIVADSAAVSNVVEYTAN